MMVTRREYLDSEGEIVKYLDILQIIHKDKEFIEKAINLIFIEVGKKALRKAKLKEKININMNYSKYYIDNIPKSDIIKVYASKKRLVYSSRSILKEIEFDL